MIVIRIFICPVADCYLIIDKLVVEHHTDGTVERHAHSNSQND